ncbi:molybdate ABC transporter substrate-binding protein [Primorskyibacter sedentarius]|nr:molybdate ABC transporter substrate-binding protein [Primorskyibacter sedentarius]
MNSVHRLLLRLVFVLLVVPCVAVAGEVTVFAAASTKTALDDVAEAWTAQTGHRAVIAYAGSSALARQIDHGAPADVFISANADWMDVLERAGLLRGGTRQDLLGNRLVLIAHGQAAEVEVGPELDLAGLLGEERLAMALVEAVPAGIYGKAALEALGLWASVAGQVAQTDNVRAALALVATGEAPLGVVYATDAVADSRVSVIGIFPEDSHPAIVYPVAAVSGGDNPLTMDFLTFLRSDAARHAFAAQGFITLRE